MEPIIKHVTPDKVFSLANEVTLTPAQVTSKTLVQNPSVGLTLFAFDEGGEISTHEAGGDALVTVLEGTGELTIAGKKHLLKAGESIIMPAKVPHSVFAPEAFKMSLLVVFPAS